MQCHAVQKNNRFKEKNILTVLLKKVKEGDDDDDNLCEIQIFYKDEKEEILGFVILLRFF